MGWVARSRAQRRPGATLEAFHGVRANCPPHWRSTVISRDARTASDGRIEVSAVAIRSLSGWMAAGGRAPDPLVEPHQLARRLAGVLGEGAAGPCASARASWCGSRRARTSTSRGSSAPPALLLADVASSACDRRLGFALSECVLVPLQLGARERAPSTTQPSKLGARVLGARAAHRALSGTRDRAWP